MKYSLITAALLMWLIAPGLLRPAYAQDHNGHTHEESQENHDKAEDHDHKDGHEQEKSDHGHGGSGEEYEEGKAEIAPDSAKRMGVAVEKAGAGAVDHTIPLTGRITLNQNTQADVRARFSGIVRNVNIDLGERVEKGQILAVIEANESLRNYNVVAPISGVVLERNTNIGDVAGDQPLFMIADISNVWAKFHVFPRDADFIESGQNVRIHTLEGDKTATGKIDMLFPTADELSQTQIAIVILENRERIWKPGMTVEGDVTVSLKQAAVTVKETALQKMEEFGDVVFVQKGDSYEPRQVKIGRKGSDNVEIISGLRAGELYVAEGSFIVKSDILKSTAAHSH
jgi:cobalt-zinc-cadmium efflux system membrane fusion protein